MKLTRQEKALIKLALEERSRHLKRITYALMGAPVQADSVICYQVEWSLNDILLRRFHDVEVN